MFKRCWTNRVLVVSLFAIVVSGLAGCDRTDAVGSVVGADVARSDAPRLPVPSLDGELVAGNTAFALDLYRVLFDQEENLFYSPHSLSAALAMTYAGARAETEQQMAEALHYTLPQAQLHAAFNALDQALAGREGEDLHIVNAVWGQQGYSFLDAFLDILAENYGAGLQTMDFGSDEARRLINQWVSDQTESRIHDLLPPGAVDGETALVLTNAVYFKAGWMHPFDESLTRAGSFSLLDGQETTVMMMNRLAELGYAERPGVQAVELPYAGGELSMVIVLPETGAFDEFAQGLDAGELDALLSDIEPRGVQLAMPRFGFDAALGLKDALMELGMVDAFGAADFSGMDGSRELFIDQVYHQAYLAVDEAGTEAAASSAVVMARKGAPEVEQEVRVDRPFIFLIRDVETGAILFLGHVLNPAA